MQTARRSRSHCEAGAGDAAPALLLALLATLAAGCSAARPPAGSPPPSAAQQPARFDGAFGTVEVETVGWDEASDSPVVLLREPDTGKTVPIWVGLAEAQSIASALAGVEPPRPMTHDLMARLLDRLGAHLDTLTIHDVVDGTYYGLLEVSMADGGEPVLIDARPSDGLALALRSGTVIRVARSILDAPPGGERPAQKASVSAPPHRVPAALR